MSTDIKNSPVLEFKPTKEQAQAMSHFGSDLLISAGAGSGKTATLTDRIVSRICDKGADISRMLVVTYTKDAANELKVRIAKKLSERLKREPKNAHLCSQIVKVTSADISTIHSFCLKCLRPYFDRLGLDSDFRIGEESELAVIRQEAITAVLDRFYEADECDPDFLLVSDCYSEYTDDTALDASLLELYNRLCSCADGLEILLKPTDENEEFLHSAYGQILYVKVARLVIHFYPLVEELYLDICENDANAKYYDTFEELFLVLSSLKHAFCNNPTYEKIKKILDGYTAKRIKGGKSKNTPTVDTEYLSYIKEDLADELKDLRDNYFYSDTEAIKSTVKQNEKICKAIYKVLKEYENEYRERKRKYSLCDFNDLERYTKELFYDGEGISPIAKEIGESYDEIYIDEYQDVNSVQDKIFSAISRNNRFMVGDIKQSIYGFRSAEPELFSAYRDSFAPYEEANSGQGRTIFMSDNFRCDPSVIKLTNHISDYMFFNSCGFNYVEGDRLKNAKLQKDTFVPQNAELCIIDKSSITEDSHLKELDPQAEFVAQEIKRLLDGGKLPSGEKIEPRHIAILLRKSLDCIEKYIDALNRYGIKNEYIQEISFFEKPHILLLLCILNSIDNPSRDVYLAGAMHSHIWSFSLEELVKIKRFSPSEYSLYSALKNYGGDKDLREKVDSLLKRLDAYRTQIRKMSAEEAISYVMNETGYLSSCKAEQRRDVIKLYNMARSYEQGSYKGLYSFLRYVDNVAAQRGVSEAVSTDPENSVKIITMHKSKGLEYEICFLCDTDKAFSKKSYTSPLLFHRSLGICGYVSRQGGIVKYNNILRRCASLAIKESELEESERLLYVAMTRARSKLYITASMTKQAEKRKKHARLYEAADEYTLYSYNNHIDMILGACPHPLDFLDLRIVTEEDIPPFERVLEEQNAPNPERVQELENVLRDRLSFEYKYGYLEKIPSKLSISTLYPQILDSDENDEYVKSYSFESLPSFIGKKESLITASDRGTATHVFLQFCDFENLQKHGVECELKRLLDNSFISQAVGEIINKKHIEMFISSHMMKEFLNAKRLIREFRFNVMLNANEFSNDEMLKNQQVLVQGVTDCIYENEDGELILVDYKTDAVTEENYVSVLTARHKMQLTYYKKACEMMFEQPISKVLIYSVPLAKTVEIKS